ncbi:MAG: hypothetical protein IPP33_18775 [Flavobacteriales bacterium]|nr:hypothetical protein [Flavobacteriales bacterium]
MTFFLNAGSAAQAGIKLFGIQAKPVIPFGFFDPITRLKGGEITGSFELTGGFSFGMLVRAGITPNITFETGISKIDRRFEISVANDTSGYREQNKLRFIGYEIPAMALVFVRLGERTFMNNAIGFSLDMYPSDAEVVLDESTVYLARTNWAQFGVVGNIGAEYRTRKSGTIYLGATYHRPFGNMGQAEVRWYDRGFSETLIKGGIGGSYLTVDLRYFFHSDPDRVPRKRTKKKKE